ncbi:MAG: hypothetical protein HOO00_02300 [Rhodospirillaceae bacterium]|jgi:hypothetical protein|nr:hypothetical protein [Rhodospirillaceae bacterium]MBT5373181.1 hypothetical protein [Rhodospirillaceae bacterium]MBT5660188.1 hypothetical protein [Rhodospirillaceae bacterium]
MANEHTKSIKALEQQIEELERKANEMRAAVNVLCALDSLPPRYSEDDVGGKKAVSTQIRDDTFYGKKQQTAAREYLEMRHTQDLGPAKPREIYDALKDGGYPFDAKSDEIALVGLRAMLRKRTTVFHKLPTGSYGLTSWYPDAKTTKNTGANDGDDSDDLDDEDDVNETADDDKSSAV